jgi:hypothetical protein
MERNNHLKCKFCDFKTLKFFRTKRGTVNGLEAAYNRLRRHVEVTHPEVYEAIEKAEAEVVL